jgi:hypothetical protein
MSTLDFSKHTNTNCVAEDWCDELVNDIAFPMVNVKQIWMMDGFSREERYNPYIQTLMHAMFIKFLVNHDYRARFITKREVGDSLCDLCGYVPCVWISERENVVAVNKNEHGHMITIVNKTQCKIAFHSIVCFM